MPRLRQPTLADFILLLALMFVVFALAQALVEYLTLAGEAIRYPYPLEYGEGPILDQVVRLARGESVYPAALTLPPHRVTHDPPLFHLVQAPFIAAGPTFAHGRTVSLAGALAGVAFLTLIAHRLTGDWLASLIGGFLLLAFPHVVFWSLFNRADTLALALSLAALYAVLRWSQRRLGLALAAALFVLAIYTRLDFLLAGPATAALWLASQRRRREALWLLIGVAGASLAIFLALNLATAGGFFQHVITARLIGFSLFPVVGQFINLFVHAAFIIIGGILFLVLERTSEPTRSWHFALIYPICAALAGLAAGLPGSSVNSVYELVAAVCVLTAATIAWVGSNPWLRIAALAVVALQLTDLRDWTREDYWPVVVGKMQLRREVTQLAEMVQRAEGDVLADEFNGLLPLQGRRIYIQPAEFMQLHQAGLWSDAALVEAIERRTFPVIALYEPMGGAAQIVQRWTPRVRQAIYANYEQTGRLAEALIYTPRH
ncbi:MAG: glycosyltransferase family 39 protein [Anaerolineae bacterium]|nr:glycosyltransferase family 39 protein [Candidatus Roseilinea sp.]MDW8448976.1 glycosyltransferase family 39 protein [Anaerolineae bacterium]